MNVFRLLLFLGRFAPEPNGDAASRFYIHPWFFKPHDVTMVGALLMVFPGCMRYNQGDFTCDLPGIHRSILKVLIPPQSPPGNCYSTTPCRRGFSGWMQTMLLVSPIAFIFIYTHSANESKKKNTIIRFFIELFFFNLHPLANCQLNTTSLLY